MKVESMWKNSLLGRQKEKMEKEGNGAGNNA